MPSTIKEKESIGRSPNNSCVIALVPHQGDEPIDHEIKQLQDAARLSSKRIEIMKRLGWAFVRKARLSYDPGYYKLAEQCSLCVQSEKDNDPDAVLLAGHVLHSLHKFKEAESTARKLITLRNEASDYGLLGDVVMEQGRVDEAVTFYQKMIDLRPDLQGYLRIAYVRWLKGDLDGAREVMRNAVTAGGQRESEATAWAYTRSGIFELQAGNVEAALRSAEIALQFTEHYPPALLLRGRVLLAQGKVLESVKSLQEAATRASLPEYQWTLADALREARRTSEPEKMESDLLVSGANNDPRTFAVYLTTRGYRVEQALALARAELSVRADVFTMDALAWALKANGRVAEAREYAQKSLREGTRDGRLFYHVGSIAMANGDYAAAREWLQRADEIKQTLLPSERHDLDRQFIALREQEHTPGIGRSN
jgi:tetratricopeptide (TPR) repeat protein